MPPQLRQQVSLRLRDSSCQPVVLTKAFAAKVFPEMEMVIGPCYQGHYSVVAEIIENDDDDASVRLIRDADELLLRALKK